LQFRDRFDAGQELARRLHFYKNDPNVVILGLPRGGIPVAYEVARELNAPLDVFLVRKLGVPGQEELAMGAIASGGIRVIHDRIVADLGIPPEQIERVTAEQQKDLERRERLYRGTRPGLPLKDRFVIVVDDGLATGSTMKAALAAIRQQQPARLIVAVPTAPAETCTHLQHVADEVVCLMTPEPFYAVGGSYLDFHQTTEEEVQDLIKRSIFENRPSGV
jgi:putative phosphoribosyl transferase